MLLRLIFCLFSLFLLFMEPDKQIIKHRAKSPKGNLVWEDINIQSANVFIYLFSVSLDAFFYIVLE